MKLQKKISVVHIITKLELGGAQKVCLELVEGLKNESVEIYLISGVQGTIAHRVKHIPNVFLLPSLKREVSFFNFFYEIKTFISIIGILRNLKKKYPDIIVHTHSTKAGLVGRWAAFFVGIKIRIHTIHGYGFNPYQNWIVWTIIYFLEFISSFITSHYICVSSEDVKTGIRLFPRFAKKHTIIRAAISWSQFYIPAVKTQWPASQDRPFIFGTVSSFTQPGKNIVELLQAFLRVHEYCSDIRLEIIGGGYLQRQAQEWVNNHPEIIDKVTFWGWQEQIVPIMLKWHAFIFTSLWEGLPCAIVEARMLKLPILSYKTGGISDVIFHGENGFLYPQKQWQALAQGMQELLDNPELYEKFRLYNDHLDQFNNITMIKNHKKLYDFLKKS